MQLAIFTIFSPSGNVLQNEANEFFVGFGNNCPILQEPELIISVTTSSQDTVRFTVDTLSDFEYNGTVSLGSPAKIVIPLAFMVSDDSTSQRQKGIHVKAEGNKTVSVFGMNHGDQSTDAYLALPCNHLPVVGYEYFAVTYESENSSYNPFVLLVGCENSTTINTAVSKFTLNRLETYLMINATTGTRVVLSFLATNVLRFHIMVVILLSSFLQHPHGVPSFWVVHMLLHTPFWQPVMKQWLQLTATHHLQSLHILP